MELLPAVVAELYSTPPPKDVIMMKKNGPLQHGLWCEAACYKVIQNFKIYCIMQALYLMFTFLENNYVAYNDPEDLE